MPGALLLRLSSYHSKKYKEWTQFMLICLNTIEDTGNVALSLKLDSWSYIPQTVILPRPEGWGVNSFVLIYLRTVKQGTGNAALSSLCAAIDYGSFKWPVVMLKLQRNETSKLRDLKIQGKMQQIFYNHSVWSKISTISSWGSDLIWYSGIEKKK